MLHFIYPWMFLLLPLPLLVRYLAPAYREPRAAVRVPFLELLSRLTGQQQSQGTALVQRTRLQKAQVVLAWLALVVALARPVWMDDPIVRTDLFTGSIRRIRPVSVPAQSHLPSQQTSEIRALVSRNISSISRRMMNITLSKPARRASYTE